MLFIEGVSQPRLDPEVVGLPAYMLPNRTVVLEALPTNPHGKLDRPALQALAESEP